MELITYIVTWKSRIKVLTSGSWREHTCYLLRKTDGDMHWEEKDLWGITVRRSRMKPKWEDLKMEQKLRTEVKKPQPNTRNRSIREKGKNESKTPYR